ncbi:hypothetical protein CVT26_003264 [Gymnopilus dilepis]|uniref:Uncharacterized protein n=1 Tax=Gymnopilus dilepis TaxID=231916 RepID=A0A409Y4Y1_9AGAR|nr:hypothetical protein CVT26_003264 [Gymnopilus dilepis]
MTNHADPLRELTQPETQHDRRSPFFNPTRKLSQVLAKSIAHNSSSSTSSAQRPARSQTAWETSSGSSRSSSSPSQKKLKTTKAPSPQVVSSILDGMYAYPTNAQVTILARQPVRQVLPSSPLLNNLPSSSAAPSLISRASSESKSQYSLDSYTEFSNQDPRLVADTPNSHFNVSSEQASHDVDNSVTSVSDHSSVPSTSSASGGTESEASSSNFSGGSSSSSSSTSTLRMVGRGGSGSRLRIVTSAPDNLDPARLRQERPPIIRPAGRGGLGSRPKPLGASPLPPRDAVQPQVAQEPVLVRPIGRGGLGSRQKPLKSPPTLTAIWNKRSTKSLKGKEKTTETRFIHPIPPHESWRISGGTTSTLSSIHFVGEADHPAYVSPFSPVDQARRSAESNSNSRPRSLSDPSLSSFTFPQSQSTSSTVDDGVCDDYTDDNDTEELERPDHRQKSFNKLTRTLGDIPPTVFDTMNGGRSLGADHQTTPKLFLDRPVAKTDKSAKVGRRSSLSVTSLSSFFARPSSRRRDSVASHHSASTITDDVHRFPIEDDSLDQWGSTSDFIADSRRTPSPDSPIMFAPPSPAPGLNSASSGRDLDAPAEPEQEDSEDAPYTPSPTLSRSFSYTPLSRRRSATASHNHSASASLLTFRSESPAFTTNWMIPPSSDDEEVVFAVTHHIPEKPQVWTGEWNGDLQDVIKSLRALR